MLERAKQQGLRVGRGGMVLGFCSEPDKLLAKTADGWDTFKRACTRFAIDYKGFSDNLHYV